MNRPRGEWIRFVGDNVKQIANTVVETTQFPTGQGTLVLQPENMQPGKIYRLLLRGVISTNGNPAATLKVYFGSSPIVTSSGTPGSNLNSACTELVGDIRVISSGATGSIVFNGMTRAIQQAGVQALQGRALYSDVTTINTTVPCAIDVTYQWGVADPLNILTITHATVEEWTT